MRIAVIEDEAPIREGMSKILKKINENYELVGRPWNRRRRIFPKNRARSSCSAWNISF